jgi:hypothetical protein
MLTPMNIDGFSVGDAQKHGRTLLVVRDKSALIVVQRFSRQYLLDPGPLYHAQPPTFLIRLSIQTSVWAPISVHSTTVSFP